ncbi:MAG: YfiR family protein, partial [Steroidobacteraceae bacterium]
MRRSALLLMLLALAGSAVAPRARADELPEYRLKAAFLYNFALFTDWSASVGPTLNLCLYGRNPFGAELDGLEGKAVGERHLAVHRLPDLEALKD